MATDPNKLTIRRWVDAAWNQGYLAVAEEIYDRAYVIHALPPGFSNDRDGLLRFVTAFRGAFPDLHFTVEDLIGEEDRVAWRLTVRGTQHGEVLGIPPTGQPITVSAIVISRFAGDRIVEEWVSWDQLGMLQQLGVIPTPGLNSGASK